MAPPRSCCRHPKAGPDTASRVRLQPYFGCRPIEKSKPFGDVGQPDPAPFRFLVEACSVIAEGHSQPARLLFGRDGDDPAILRADAMLYRILGESRQCERGETSIEQAIRHITVKSETAAHTRGTYFG